MATYNGVTGDALVTRVGNKEQQQKYADNYDKIFSKKPTERNPDPDWDEGRIDIIGQNGPTGEHYEWRKHDESSNCPVNSTDWIEVETYISRSFKELAGNLEWKYVKFYRVIPEKK
jgi:hypothetical protein